MRQSINISTLPIIAPFSNGQVSKIVNHFRGTVVDKTVTGDKFVSYKIADRFNPNEIFTVISSRCNYLPMDSMSFTDMHEDVEVDDTVSIYGMSARSKKGNFYIKATGVFTREYGNNHYESESEHEDQGDLVILDSDESDDEYVPSESEDGSDTESETEEDVCEESYQPTLEELNELHFSLPKVPLDIYNQFVKYQGKCFAIDFIRTDIPFKVTLATKLGDFHVSKMDRKFIGIYIPGNSLERDHPNGYDMILSGKFSDLLKALE